MKCENCQQEHCGNFGSGRFCTEKCARSFSTKTKRTEINKQVSATLLQRHEAGEISIANPFKCGYDSRRDTIPHKSGVYKHSDDTKAKIKKILTKRGEDNFKLKTQTMPFETLPKDMRRKFLLLERGNKCECCGLETWLETPLIIHIDHIDGNHKNNIKENIRLLCPNCHSLTPTWKGKNIKTRVSKEDFINSLKSSINIHQALKKLGLNPVGGNYNTARKLQSKMNASNI